MENTVFFIKTKGNNLNYYANMERIIEITNFYQNIRNDKKILLNINPQNIEDNEYITNEILSTIQNKIREKDCESIIIAEDRLYSRNNRDSKVILSEKKFNVKTLSSKNNIKNVTNKNGLNIPILEDVLHNDYMILFTHFKGHPMIGFSGALKNLASSCIGLTGQINLHQLAKPFISKIRCLACNECINVCPENAINVDTSAHIKQEICTGCNVCIESCPNMAIKLNKLTSDVVIKRICDINSTILNYKKDNKVLFINSLIDIKAYDCTVNSEKISEDIGILASYNPVALDKACYDLINENSEEDKFKKLWPNIDGTLQFKYAEELGIGLEDYELIII